MAIIVQKYGGSSVADVERLKRVAGQVVACRRAGHQVVVVVSAMGKTTDGLLAQAHAVTANPDRRELDMLLSVGERVSMSLLALAIRDLGEEAISFTGSQSGIITNDRHADARIIEVRPFRIEDELGRGRIVIVAGYQGVSYRKEVTTLGRGGSDTTAVALAAALRADRCEIYSDVDGVYTADPRLVPEATRLPSISCGEMQELAEAGAKVLNAQAVEWARRAGIALYARKTGDPSEGTLVRLDAPPATTRVRALAHRAEVLWLEAEAPPPEVLGFLDDHHAPAEAAWLEGTRTRAILPLDNLHGRGSLLTALEARFPGQARLRDGVGAVSLVGDGMAATHETLRETLATLAGLGIPVVAAHATGLRLTVVVPVEGVGPAVRALHARFIPPG
jgi:aspartate kinase